MFQERLRGESIKSKRAAMATAGVLFLGGAAGCSTSHAQEALPLQPQSTQTVVEHVTSTQESPHKKVPDMLWDNYNRSSATLLHKPFLTKLSPLEKKRLQQLEDNANRTMDEQNELSQLNTKDTDTRNLTKQIKRYDASFIGAMETQSGIKFNFLQMKSQQKRHVKINPRSIDAYLSWMIDVINNEYQDFPSQQKINADNRKHMIDLQEWAKNKTMGNYTVNLFINPDKGECFTNNIKVVKDKDKDCKDVGFTTYESYSRNMYTTAYNWDNTRPTEISNEKHPSFWISDQAINATFVHEAAHVLRDISGMNRGKPDRVTKSGKDILGDEHKGIVHPLENKFIYMQTHYKDLPPLPLWLS